MNFARKIFVTLVTVVAVYGLLLAGCHTVKGFGQDIQSGGKAISKAADTDKHKK